MVLPCSSPDNFRALVPHRINGNNYLAWSLWRVAARKLELLDSVIHRDELKVPPGNRLEALSGDRKGQHSIRVNDQYRICFKWTEAGPDEVELTDYH
jgi:proteic killer suppression protein